MKISILNGGWIYILKKADDITCVSKIYYAGYMQKRNKHIANKCDLVIVVYNGLNGEAKQTIEYENVQVKK